MCCSDPQSPKRGLTDTRGTGHWNLDIDMLRDYKRRILDTDPRSPGPMSTSGTHQGGRTRPGPRGRSQGTRGRSSVALSQTVCSQAASQTRPAKREPSIVFKKLILIKGSLYFVSGNKVDIKFLKKWRDVGVSTYKGAISREDIF